MHECVCAYIYILWFVIVMTLAKLAGAVEYTNCIFAEG